MSVLSDHRARQTPVRDQQQRGACVGFAVAAAHEWMRPAAVRSVEDVLWAAHQIGGDPRQEGTSVLFALTGLEQHQHAEETAWPFGEPPFPADRPAAADQPDRQAALPVWRRMAGDDPDAVASEVVRGAAVVLTLAVVPGAWSKTGLVDAPAGRKTRGRHAVLAVGSLDSAGAEPEGGTLIKNSWGAGWGLAGYGVVSSRYLSSYATVAHVLEPAA
jgi:C1A family cysteine protease